jgi:hypothetical protein
VCSVIVGEEEDDIRPIIFGGLLVCRERDDWQRGGDNE